MTIRLVVGLGNPGPRYAATRHNVGFRVVEKVSQRLVAQPWPGPSLSKVEHVVGLWLARPQTFMNASGAAVEELLDAFELEPEALLVVSDDLDLPLGRLRLRPSGGAGTHNGLRDIVDRIGTGFPRLRVGIRGAVVGEDLAAWVLSPFEDDELANVDVTIVRAAGAVVTVLDLGVERAMAEVNRRPPDVGEEGPAIP
jgi:PTH1 family peptidyl-tRNA hydrolase